MKLASNERGVALVVAILAMVVIGGLVTASFTPSLLEQRIAENQKRAAQAFGTAEYGLSGSIGQWDVAAWNVLAWGDSVQFSGSMTSGVGSYDGWIYRLNDEIFVVDLMGEDRSNGSRTRLAQYVKLRPIGMDVQASLTTQNPITIDGGTNIDGTDTSPWGTCAPPLSDAGVRMPSLADINWTNCPSSDCYSGSPGGEQDTDVADSTFVRYGEEDWADLVSMATNTITNTIVTIAPSISAGECNTTDLYNWGEPTNPASPCADHFPIIHTAGNLSITGQRGQGVLLVGGDLDIAGTFDFYGVVVARGRLSVDANARITGALMAENPGGNAQIVGSATVQYSSCAVRRALLRASPGAPLRSRGWLTAY